MPDEELESVLKSLSEQDKVLIVCNYQLYDDNWNAMEKNLKNRLEGRPYVLKLGERIREDLERVKRLREIENKFDIKLGDYVKV